MTQTDFQTIIDHCTASYKALETAIDEYNAAIAGYYGERSEDANNHGEKFCDSLSSADCIQMIRDLVGVVYVYYHCEQKG